MARVLIVGGGILGTAHAVEALGRGWDVVQFETSAEPKAATPRSVGALHFSRCAPGLELHLAMAAARSWRELASHTSRPLVREVGSLVVATTAADARLLTGLSERADAEDRGWRLVGPDRARELLPVLQGDITAALRSELDLVIEPRSLLESLRTILLNDGRYTFKGGVEVRDVSADSVTDASGRTHRGDFVVLCPGSRSDLAVSVMRHPSILRSTRIQVAQTERFDGNLPIPVSDLAALANSGIGRAEELTGTVADPLLGTTEVGLTCVQRRNRTLTVGEARDDNEALEFDIAQRPADVLMGRLATILGTQPPKVARQWVGSVRSCIDGRLWLREDLDETVALITCAAQRGILLAPVIASETFDWLLHGIDSGATRPGADGGRVD